MSVCKQELKTLRNIGKRITNKFITNYLLSINWFLTNTLQNFFFDSNSNLLHFIILKFKIIKQYFFFSAPISNSIKCLQITLIF
jgi:hypothetical protein